MVDTTSGGQRPTQYKSCTRAQAAVYAHMTNNAAPICATGWCQISALEQPEVPAVQALQLARSTAPAADAHLSVQVEEQVSSIDEVQHQVQLAGCLEAVAQCYDVRVHDCCQNITLSTNIVAMVLLQDSLLAHHLHGKYSATGASTDLKHLHRRKAAA